MQSVREGLSPHAARVDTGSGRKRRRHVSRSGAGAVGQQQADRGQHAGLGRGQVDSDENMGDSDEDMDTLYTAPANAQPDLDDGSGDDSDVANSADDEEHADFPEIAAALGDFQPLRPTRPRRRTRRDSEIARAEAWNGIRPDLDEAVAARSAMPAGQACMNQVNGEACVRPALFLCGHCISQPYFCSTCALEHDRWAADHVKEEWDGEQFVPVAPGDVTIDTSGRCSARRSNRLHMHCLH